MCWVILSVWQPWTVVEAGTMNQAYHGSYGYILDHELHDSLDDFGDHPNGATNGQPIKSQLKEVYFCFSGSKKK